VGYATLIQIHLATNGITAIEPGTFDQFSQLKQLRIFDNLIQDLSPTAFRGLTQLNILCVRCHHCDALSEFACVQ
jgi:hypothetical protein